MNRKLKSILMLTLACCLISAHAQDSTVTMSKKKSTAKKEPTVSEQIQELRTEFQQKVDTLQQEIADRDAKLAAAQQTAAAAQQQAADASAKADTVSSSADTDNASVSKLSSAVADLTLNSQSLAQTVQDNQKAVTAAINSPDTIHYKGVTISPAGSFIEAATVNRSAAIGDDINTHWTSIPLQYAQNAQLSEFYGSGRQSRIALKATGKLGNATLTGYYEMDWLGAGVTSNNNQSNSYVVRERQLWARAEMTNGWTAVGGAMWSLATETTQGMTNGSEILPSTIDAAYEPGFVWTRQYGFRVYKNFNNKVWLGASAENAEMLNPAGTSLPTNYVFGVAGDTGGLYDNQSNYSFNKTPDFIVKAVFEPGWGHYELFSITRTFRDRIYTGLPYNDTEVGQGFGGGFRGSLDNKKVTIGLKGLIGQGMGRYGDSTIADVTVKPSGILEPLKGFSALSTVEFNPNKKLTVYMNYGGDYISRDLTIPGGGYGAYAVNMSGCNTEVATASSNITPSAPANCGANTKDVQEGTIGYWYNFYNGPMGRFRQGIQYSYAVRNLWSGTGSATAPSGVTGIADPTGSAKGIDNMIFTSLRYYLP
jgi:hypothetical protein